MASDTVSVMTSSIRTILIKRITIIFIITFIVVLSSVAIITIYTANTYLKNSEKQLFQALLTKGNTLVINNAQALIDMVSDNSFSAINNLVSATVRNDNNIIYGIFMDANLNPWIISNQNSHQVHYNKTLTDNLSLRANALKKNTYFKVNSEAPLEYTSIKKNKTVYEFAAPVFSRIEPGEPIEFLGTIRYGIATGQMESARIEAKAFSVQIMIITLLTLFILGCIAFILSFIATRHTANIISLPLIELSQATVKIAQGNYDTTIVIDNDNEIGVLSQNFNKMQEKIKDTLGQLLVHQKELKDKNKRLKVTQEELQDFNRHLEDKVNERTAQLKSAQKELLASAHAAGIAEVAINILHNIGNVINSVNISNQDNLDRLRHSKIPALIKTNHLLQKNSEHIGQFLQTDPKGKKIPKLLDKLGQALNNENHILIENSSRMMQSINIIGNIITTQQQYAKGNLYNETLDLHSLVEESLNIQEASFKNHSITTRTEFQNIPSITTDSAKLHQILTNILINAKQALLNNQVENRKIQIKLSQKLGFAILTIKDNGIGIDKNSLIEIFQHGFTTKKNGHGFGLHSCANLLAEMGGNIKAKSEGKNKGAMFIIKLPLS
jgi:signal transduction histidine kinase